MNKTGPQLLELSPQEGFLIQEKYVAADALYSQIKEDVKKRAQTLDEAISQSTQVFGGFFVAVFFFSRRKADLFPLDSLANLDHCICSTYSVYQEYKSPYAR